MKLADKDLPTRSQTARHAAIVARAKATRDVLLSPEVTAMNPSMMGRVWDGMSKADAEADMRATVDYVVKYGRERGIEMTAGPAGSLATGMSRASVGDSGGAWLRRQRDEAGIAIRKMYADMSAPHRK